MNDDSVGNLVGLIRGMSLRCRTAIILLSSADLGHEREVAARLGLDSVDYIEEILRGVAPGAPFVEISPEADETRLHSLIHGTSGGDALLVYNFDVALARMEPGDRHYLWLSIRDRLAYGRKALLIAMPRGAVQLLPPDQDLASWRTDRRIADYESQEERNVASDPGCSSTK